MNRRIFTAGLAGIGARFAIRGADAAGSVSTITDEKGREMVYRLTMDPNPSQARTIFLLHGHGSNQDPSSSWSPGWNVVAPLDRFGYQGQGSWWLGEGGDFFTLRLLHRLVKRVANKTGGNKGLYFSGSSMGGYGSILHGILLGARAVCANAAQTRLTGTMFDDFLGRAMHPVLGEETDHRYADLGKMLRGRDPHTLPIFFLGFNRFDHPDQNYFAEHLVPFIEACGESGANVATEVYPVEGHNTGRSFSQIVGQFDKYRDEIEAW